MLSTADFPRMWLTLLPLLLDLVQPVQAQDPTTAFMFLPQYRLGAWDYLQGSIISTSGTDTVYTAFCAPYIKASAGYYSPCTIEGTDKFPFIFTEGPATLHVGYTAESSYTIDLDCDLAGTTAATCRGTTSLAADFSVGPLNGPTAFTVPPVTLTGTDVEWAPLTLGEPPQTTVSGGGTITVYPSETGTSVGASTTATPTTSQSAASSSASSESSASTGTTTTSAAPSSAMKALDTGLGRVSASLALVALVSALILR
ncbi:hypothetical protein F4677DRAFT_279607 [Hypoxylon crocopeplum]|nr:hypothetical protein F4677DRAFT_279607 [Hypoxylon crocopeplum]